MRWLIFITVLLTLKLLDISPSDVGVVFVVSLMVGGVMAGVQDINEIIRK